ncbi:MAG TPA: hypothetical protein VFD52_07305 [Clostridia bacterium]|nr:hypothetical protein [Clostridia bacterium]
MQISQNIIKIATCVLTICAVLFCSSCNSKTQLADAQEVANRLIGQVEFKDFQFHTAQNGCNSSEENSFLGAKTGLKSSAYAIQVDVSFLTDGTPVLANSFHQADETSVPLEKILEEMQKYSEKKLYIHLREVSNITGLEKLIKDFNLTNSSAYICVDENIVKYLYNECCVLPVYMSLDINAGPKQDESAIISELEKISVYSPNGIVIPAKNITKLLVSTAHDMGLEVFSIDTNSSQEIADMISLGVDNIITKSPDVLTEAINIWAEALHIED